MENDLVLSLKVKYVPFDQQFLSHVYILEKLLMHEPVDMYKIISSCIYNDKKINYKQTKCPLTRNGWMHFAKTTQGLIQLWKWMYYQLDATTQTYLLKCDVEWIKQVSEDYTQYDTIFTKLKPSKLK